ncbi:hypothetical protein JX266_004874 [Neoarthrinium moseri]|nr:hypothetical protein JX266_004874 [Neoarthrinium moseri]
MKITTVCLLILQAVLLAPSTASAAALPRQANTTDLPKRTIAGISVVDTPIVQAAHGLARMYSEPYLYKHIMRCWLFGTLILTHNETLAASVDPEVHAVSVLLHDLGLSPSSPFLSADRRFEVDGAFAATSFVANFTTASGSGPKGHAAAWDAQRRQLVWDAIALHTERSIHEFKEPAVAVTGNGIGMDFRGADYGVTAAEYAAVLHEYPQEDLLGGFNASLVWLAHTKPSSTYDTWQQPWGDNYVANYSAVGHRTFDIIALSKTQITESE